MIITLLGPFIFIVIFIRLFLPLINPFYWNLFTSHNNVNIYAIYIIQ